MCGINKTSQCISASNLCMAEWIAAIPSVVFRFLAVQLLSEHTGLIVDGQFLIFAVLDFFLSSVTLFLNC
jgi:hypothetical protein